MQAGKVILILTDGRPPVYQKGPGPLGKIITRPAKNVRQADRNGRKIT
jgi:hypothetical protein